jgi:hypothetical protein
MFLQFDFKSGAALSARSILIWRIVQIAVWVLGAAILTCLLFFPSIGVILFWNILIPIAPFLFVVAVGVWRNVCPLATTNLLPRKLGVSKQKKLTNKQVGLFNLIAVIALYIIVPLRHAIFNNNGFATGIMIIIMAIIGVSLGFVYEWKSAWCSGLCPVHPVEKLYGSNVFVSLPNANCDHCQNCVVPCPDSTPNMTPVSATKTIYHRISGWLVVAGLPGFIWGWFHVPDSSRITSLMEVLNVYALPVLGMLISAAVYFVLHRLFGPSKDKTLTRVFAAAGVSFYYIFRIPALFGFGKYNHDGMLVNLNGVIPEWVPHIITIMTTLFFLYWLVIRQPNKASWVIRPPFVQKVSA